MTGERIITVPNMSAGFSIIWGLWALWPWSPMFAKNPKLYGQMLAIVPSQQFWGALFFTAGLSVLLMSYYGRQFTGALVLSVVYALFASLYFFGDYESPGWALYGYISLVHFVFWGAHRWKVNRL